MSILPQFKHKDPKKNDGPLRHGFFVFHPTADDLTVTERKSDATCGMTARKNLLAVTPSTQSATSCP